MRPRRITESLGARGVTLVELVVALAVSSLILIGVLRLWQESQELYLQGAESVDVQQNLRVAMDRMVRVIQAAGVNPNNQPFAGATANDPAFAAFRSAGPRCLRLYADINSNSNVSSTDENILFYWNATDGTALSQYSGVSAGDPDGAPDVGAAYVAASGGAQELAQGIVANPGGTAIFQYYTGLNDPTPNTLIAAGTGCGATGMTAVNRTTIGRIVITLTARGTVGGKAFTKTLVSEARPRNAP